MSWRIYYDGGVVITNEEMDVTEVPIFGIMVIVQTDIDHRWTTESQFDYYVWDTRGGVSKWWGVDEMGYVDYLQMPGWKRVLLGRRTTSDEFSKIFKHASEAMKLEKVSFASWERHPS